MEDITYNAGAVFSIDDKTNIYKQNGAVWAGC